MAFVHRLSLRSRLLVAFVGGALLLSAGVAFLSYGLTRTTCSASVRRRRSVRRRPTPGWWEGRSGRPVTCRSSSGRSRARPVPARSCSTPAGGSRPRWTWVGTRSLHRSRTPWLRSARRARQRYRLNGVPRLAVGLPLADGDAYFEVFPLRELDRTLRTLRVALTTAAGVAIVGAAGLGAWASRRLLDPLAQIGATATSIAKGELHARLDVGNEVELAALAESFNQMVASLQTRIEQDARFASNVSHELRSPLTALRSALQNLETRRGTLDERTGRSRRPPGPGARSLRTARAGPHRDLPLRCRRRPGVVRARVRR